MNWKIKKKNLLSEKIYYIQKVFTQFCFRFNYILAEDKNYFLVSDDPAQPFPELRCSPCAAHSSNALTSVVLTSAPQIKKKD